MVSEVIARLVDRRRRRATAEEADDDEASEIEDSYREEFTPSRLSEDDD